MSETDIMLHRNVSEKGYTQYTYMAVHVERLGCYQVTMSALFHS